MLVLDNAYRPAPPGRDRRDTLTGRAASHVSRGFIDLWLAAPPPVLDCGAKLDTVGTPSRNRARTQRSSKPRSALARSATPYNTVQQTSRSAALMGAGM
jgi:hypothetical protein